MAETDTSGNTLNEYIFFGGRIARRNSSGNVYYYFGNHLGSAAITNATGTLCYDADFCPIGGELAFTNNCSQNYKFAGMEQDPETGDYHALFRQYSASLGRWLGPDPAGLAAADPTNPQSWNRYAHVLNNPCSLTDPLGLDNCNLNIAVNNQTGQNIDINAIQAAISQVFQASSQGQPNSVGVSFTGTPGASLNITNAGSILMWLSQNGIVTVYGQENRNLSTPPTVYWNIAQSTSPNPQNTAAFVGVYGTHELGHKLLGVNDIPYEAGSPNIMMFDDAPTDVQYNALFNPNSSFWRFSPTQISTLFKNCQKKRGSSSTGGGGGSTIPTQQGTMTLWGGTTTTSWTPEEFGSYTTWGVIWSTTYTFHGFIF